MTSKTPTVSVIIPARGSAEVLPRALESIEDQSYQNVLEVVVAAADDQTSAVAEAAGATVVRNEAGTTPAGLNLAISATRGEVIVRCDAQSVLPPDYISRAVDTLTRTGAANVGGMQIPVGETPWERAIAAAMSSSFGAGDARYRIGGEEGPVETVYLGVFRRDALERIGGFDESFVRTQDYELNHRLIESGGIVWFDPELRVLYRPRGSLARLAHQYLDYGRAKRRFARTHKGALRWRQLVAPLLTLALLASLVTSIWQPLALLGPVLYVAGLLAVGVSTRRNPLRVAMALATMHLAWGWGFLTGDRT
ncbi:MAG: glycosyltransferase family 2 protein [Actinomycetota bacterium]